jgi:hypothetical protein
MVARSLRRSNARDELKPVCLTRTCNELNTVVMYGEDFVEAAIAPASYDVESTNGSRRKDASPREQSIF